MPSSRPPFRSFSIALACTAGLFAVAFWLPGEELATTVAILSLFLGLPVCILLYRDGLRARQEAGPSNRVATAVLGMPIRILGAICLVTGLAVLGWLAYNLLIERQPEFTGVWSWQQVLVPVLLVVYGYRWARRPLAPPPVGGEAASRSSTDDPHGRTDSTPLLPR